MKLLNYKNKILSITIAVNTHITMEPNKKKQITFTRFLYEKEEVKWSFITSLLKRDEYEEVLYWISEYYYSGYVKGTWHLLWQVYYDFYSIHYSYGEKTILKNYLLWKKENHIKYVLNVDSFV